MSLRLLFAHGWALDRTLWDGVLAELGAAALDALVLDAGYYGWPAALADGEGPWLGVGQSLGALELLAAPPQGLRGLVVLDGFARFAAAPDFPEGEYPRRLQAMTRRLERDPETLVREFLDKALPGTAPPSGVSDRAPLAEGLRRLASLDARAPARRLPIWRLHATDDPVAPLALADASFAGADTRARRLRRAADHLSPLAAPAACAELIGEALRALGA